MGLSEWHFREPLIRLRRGRSVIPRPDRAKGRVKAIAILAVVALADGAGFAAASITDSSGTTAVLRRDPVLSFDTLPALPERSRILARDGTEIAVLYNDVNRKVVRLDQIAPIMAKAVVAVEDKRFYEHPGVDLRGTLRALATDVDAGSVKQGGSTITQQFVRNAYLTNSRTLTRKIKEIGMAIAIEQTHTKSEILEAYLNTAYFGEGTYGVEAAAESYFGVPASQLEPHQAALLVSLLRSPNGFSPNLDPKGATIRRDRVLDRLKEAGLIDRSDLDRAKASPLGLVPRKTEVVKMAPHFIELVKRTLLSDARLGATQKQRYETLFTGGLTIQTSLDPALQDVAEKAGAELPRGVPESAIVVMDQHTGEILAYRGGGDFATLKFDLISQGHRQPGSAFKTMSLVTALKQGYSPDLQLPGPGSCSFRLNRWETWNVDNYGGSGYGTLPLKEATAKSVNCAYANLITGYLQPADVVSTAKDLGIASPLDPYYSIALGGLRIGVTPLELTRSYATIAADGRRPEVRAILDVTDRNGKLLLVNRPSSKEVLDPNVARMTTKILEGVVDHGTATRARFGWPAAGKTGTTQSNADAWFVGFTPRLVATVWVGHPEAQIQMRNVTGGTVCAGIWRKVMMFAHEGWYPYGFLEPDASRFKKTDRPKDSKFKTVRRRPMPSPTPSAEVPAPPPATEPPAPIIDPPLPTATSTSPGSQ
ncbi:MAG: transglycosylase domain-containing protein [Actinomycetota bacterium]|nr:transglycosylase domain-containing protein [Actinomycetota bacterium]